MTAARRALWSLLLLSGGASSQQQTLPSDSVAIAPFFVRVDNARVTSNDGSGIQVTFSRPWTGPWRWGATFSHATLDTGEGGGTDFYQTATGLEISRRFGSPDHPIPIIWLGLGFVDDDVFPDADDGVNPYASAAFGLQTQPLGERGVAVQSRAVLWHEDFKGGMTDWRLELGVSIPVGRTRVVERVVEREVRVAAPPRVVYVAPPDSDGDGVPDPVDRCPNTLSGAIVDGMGCISEAQAIELEGVNFEFGSARLTDSAGRILDRAFLALRDQPEVRVEIAGHTDSIGTDASNLDLSQARAESVRTFLLLRGISADRMTARGYGERQPLTSEVTDADRAANRRVEFRIRKP